MKKIYVAEDKCICCGACVGNDPEHFDFGDNNKSHVISQENLESDALQMAISCCPTEAISIAEATDENDTEECNCEENSTCHCDHCECESCEN